MTFDINNQYQLDRATSGQNFSIDQYEVASPCTNSNSSSPRNNILNSAKKSDNLRDGYSTSSTDSSNDNDDSNTSLAYLLNFNDPSKLLKLDSNYNNLLNYQYQINQYFTNPENLLTSVNSDSAFLQSCSIANFDPNFASNSYVPIKPKVLDISEHKPVINNKNFEPKQELNNEPKIAPSYLMQPPDSESIDAATASARKNRPKRRSRTKFDKEQLDILELAFERTHYPDVNAVDRLAKMLNLTTERISVWFQNRRARFKRTKKDPKTDVSSLNLNPIKDEHGIFDNDDNESFKSITRVRSSNLINSDKYEEEKSEGASNSFNENNESDNDDLKSESETSNDKNKQNSIVNPKPIFNPITLPSSTSNSNLQKSFQLYSQPIFKQEPYFISNQVPNQQAKLPILDKNDQNSSSDSSTASSSRNPSPKPDSESSSSPELKQFENLNYPYHAYPYHPNFSQIQNPQANFQAGNFININPYQTGLNNNLYMSPIPTYPQIFQPYIDYNKSDFSGNNYFNAQNLPNYYNL